jgi:3-oxoacyl-[acyl-carrier protein] reductase
MDLELEGKAALVTGGSRGIGLAVGRRLASEGARVMICGRSADHLASAAEEIARATRGKPAASVETIAADLSDRAEVSRVVAEAAARLGRIDVLVNNAGAIRAGDFLGTPDEDWISGWALKLLGYVRMAREVLPIMQRQGRGRIVNVVGAAARNPSPSYMIGGAANAALINFTKALADLGARSGVLVTAVSPGPVRTERWQQLVRQQAAAAGKSEEEYEKEMAGGYPLGRIASPDEVADLVCFLASARASFLTGIAITIDGGITRGVWL